MCLRWAPDRSTSVPWRWVLTHKGTAEAEVFDNLNRTVVVVDMTQSTGKVPVDVFCTGIATDPERVPG